MNITLDLKFEYNIPMKLEKIPLTKFLSHLTNISQLEYLIELLPKCTDNGPWIAGGCLHRTYRKLPLENADVDVFFKNKEQFEKANFKNIECKREDHITPSGAVQNFIFCSFILLPIEGS